jgi:alpha-galactosidase
LPYFNIQGEGGGAIAVLGWPGQWACDFTADSSGGVRVRGGQELTHFVLHGGEEVRSARVVMLFYRGNRDRGQNLWRRWMRGHNMPRAADGRVPGPMIGACASHQVEEMMKADEANQKLFIDRYLQERIPLKYWWMDAGWYQNNGAWPNTGTWEVDRKRFPRGLRAICDHAHAKGVNTLLWFEPERVNPGTWLYVNHPEWLLGKDGGDKLLNLGNPEARQWWTDHADKLMTEQGIDLYRNDFNIDPLAFWRANDSPDRQGMTEMRHVEGYLAYWDELKHRRPGMLIDSCASGGRRNDVETLKRAVPLLRSDYILEPVGQQNHTYGIAPWIPYYGTGVNSFDGYVFRSQMAPWSTFCYDTRKKDQDYPALRKLVSQWEAVNRCYAGDFYPLTEYDEKPTAWMAWQFDLPEEGVGMVQAFRRDQAKDSSRTLKLKGLEADRAYVVRELVTERDVRMTGKALMEQGLPVELLKPSSDALFRYERVTAGG